MFLQEAVHSVQLDLQILAELVSLLPTDVTLAIHSIQAIIITAQSLMTKQKLKKNNNKKQCMLAVWRSLSETIEVLILNVAKNPNQTKNNKMHYCLKWINLLKCLSTIFISQISWVIGVTCSETTNS